MVFMQPLYTGLVEQHLCKREEPNQVRNSGIQALGKKGPSLPPAGMSSPPACGPALEGLLTADCKLVIASFFMVWCLRVKRVKGGIRLTKRCWGEDKSTSRMCAT